jgi:hypothetical protein
MRTHEQQTTLERTMRAELWRYNDELKRATDQLPVALRHKDYVAAGVCQTHISNATGEIARWLYMLELYEQEFPAPPTAAQPTEIL